MGPLSTFLLALTGVFQAVSTARATTLPAVWWAIVGIVLLSEFLWTWERTRDWPRSTKLLCASAISVVVIAAVGWQLSIPNIVITAKNDRAFITKAREGTVYVRFAVRFAGQSRAICRSFLNTISKEGEKAPLIAGMHLMLTAEDSGELGIFQGFTFYNGTERFFNLAQITPEKTLLITSKAYQDITKEALSPGTYMAKVEVNGDNCGPQFKDLAFKFDGERISFVDDH